MSFTETEIEIKKEINIEESKPPSNGDIAWKTILDPYFPNLIEFFYPELHAEINWSRGFHFLDKELPKITRKDSTLGGTVDKLIRVYSATGEESVVLLHIEVQNRSQSHFAKRLFDYYCRLHLRYQQPILVLAILTDESQQWRPIKYESVIWRKPVIDFYFYTNKIIDYRGNELTLKKSKNPFAWVVLVHLAAIKTQNNNNNRAEQRLTLTFNLYEQGFNKDEINALYTFMDWVLVLPESLEVRYNQEVSQYEEEHNMRYITSMERYGIKQGIQQGIKQGIQQGEEKKAKMIAKNLKTKGFGPDYIKEITGLAEKDISEL